MQEQLEKFPYNQCRGSRLGILEILGGQTGHILLANPQKEEGESAILSS